MDARDLRQAVLRYVQEQMGGPNPVKIEIHFPSGPPFALPIHGDGDGERSVETASLVTACLPPQLVTLQQIAAWCHRSKRTVQRYMADLPLPVVEGGGGRAAYWDWKEIRPHLEKMFLLKLPESLPDVRLS